MLKLAMAFVLPFLRACIRTSANVRYLGRVSPLTYSTTQRGISQTTTNNKTFTVKNHDDFDQKVINGDNPVIVDFHAEWCEPCNLMIPQLTALLAKSDNVDLAVVDVEENIDLVETFGVKAVPAILGFRNGVIVDKFIGLVDTDRLKSLIDKLAHKTRINKDE